MVIGSKVQMVVSFMSKIKSQIDATTLAYLDVAAHALEKARNSMYEHIRSDLQGLNYNRQAHELATAEASLLIEVCQNLDRLIPRENDEEVA